MYGVGTLGLVEQLCEITNFQTFRLKRQMTVLSKSQDTPYKETYNLLFNVLYCKTAQLIPQHLPIGFQPNTVRRVVVITFS